MKTKPILRTLLLLLLLALPGAAWAQDGGADMRNPAGETMTAAVSAVGGYAATGDVNVDAGMSTAARLAQQDYQWVYDLAQHLYQIGHDFRTQQIQLPPSCSTPEECNINYADFNGGALYFAFCSDYAQIDARGYCPGDDPAAWGLGSDASASLRGKLVRARELFGFLALAEPPTVAVTVDGQPVNVREIGRSGVLSTTREIANIHMIFGNEFLVDALDYRFSGSDPRADQIIAEEMNQLALARRQYELGVDVLSFAFNADFGGPSGAYIGDFFGQPEYDLFGKVSERLVQTIGEIADRHRQLGDDAAALAVYADAFGQQYVQALALANSAAERDQDFLGNGGWEIINNLEGLRTAAQAIHDGVNPFGFVDEYVPLQTYSELRQLTQGDFLRDATEDEDRAAAAQREFDRNATALNQELQNLRLTYDQRLSELCGSSGDNYVTCTGGLMEQNFHNMAAAYDRILLIQQRLNHIPQQIQIEQDRAGQVIALTLENGEDMAAIEYARGVINSYRVTEAVVTAETSSWQAGTEVRSTVSLGIPIVNGTLGFGWETQISAYAGYQHANSTTSSVSKVWDPAQQELGFLSSVAALQNAANQAQVIGANSAAVIQNLLLQQAEVMIELDIAVDEFNRVSAEHNQLVDQYHRWVNLREQAQANQLDSYLNNPAYRILRDSLTVEASRSHGLSARFAYLTAKALEYEFLVRYPNLNDIFKARTADDVDNFLNDLEAFRLALGSPGERNRYPYRISLAKDVIGLSDQNLDPNGALSATERSRLRFQNFQDVIAASVVTDTSGAVIAIEIPFSTSLLDNRIFTPNIWNNRIAGVGLPLDVPNTQGIAVNVLTRQFGNVGTPEVQLTHSGHASYRTATGALVQYVPENAKLSGYIVPAGFESKTKTATILSSVNGNGQGTPSSAFFNRSVAASHWILRIDLNSPFNRQLQLDQIEDIEIQMDTTGVALGG